MKKTSLLAGALLVAAPVLALVPGCGGGNGGIVTPTSAPTALPTITPLPTESGTPSATTTGTPSATTTATAGPTATATSIPTNTPLPTSTPVPTSTSIPPGAVRANLTFTPSSDSNFKNFPLSSAGFSFRTANGVSVLGFQAQSGSVDSESIILSGELLNAGQGNGYGASSAGADTIQIRNDVRENGSIRMRTYRLQSGTITITKLSASNTTLSFNNAVFAPSTNSGGATGTVTVRGTISGPYTTN